MLDKVREQIRLKLYSIRTERVYFDCIKSYIRFYRCRHPLGELPPTFVGT